MSMDRETARRIEFARQAERTLPDDLDWHMWAWQAVLQADPTTAEAHAALGRLTRQRADRDVASHLDSVLPQAHRAAATHQLGELNALLERVRVWRTLGEQPPGLSPALHDRVLDLERQVEDICRQTVDRLAQVSDLMQAADYREAYRQARQALERGILKLIDRDSGAAVETAQLCDAARDRWLTALRHLAVQTASQAEAMGRHDPEAGLYRLHEARAQLVDDVLTTDDRVALRSQRESLDRLLNRLRERLTRFKQAQSWVIASYSQPDAEALTLLRLAQTVFPNYPDLDTRLAEVQTRQAASVGARLATAITETRRLMACDEYALAAQSLAQARAWLATLGPEASQRAGLAAVEGELVQAERCHHHLLVLLAEVDTALHQAHAGDADALALAHHLLAQLNPDQLAHPAAALRRARLAIIETK